MIAGGDPATGLLLSTILGVVGGIASGNPLQILSGAANLAMPAVAPGMFAANAASSIPSATASLPTNSLTPAMALSRMAPTSFGFVPDPTLMAELASMSNTGAGALSGMEGFAQFPTSFSGASTTPGMSSFTSPQASWGGLGVGSLLNQGVGSTLPGSTALSAPGSGQGSNLLGIVQEMMKQKQKSDMMSQLIKGGGGLVSGIAGALNKPRDPNEPYNIDPAARSLGSAPPMGREWVPSEQTKAAQKKYQARLLANKLFKGGK
jgi:hypothetical protein